MLTAEGETRPVAKLESLEGPVHVFNFEVANNHNYYCVSDEQVLVHNPRCKYTNSSSRHIVNRHMKLNGGAERDAAGIFTKQDGSLLTGHQQRNAFLEEIRSVASNVDENGWRNTGGRYSYEHQFDRNIGRGTRVGSDGTVELTNNMLRSLRIIVDEDYKIITAYPIQSMRPF